MFRADLSDLRRALLRERANAENLRLLTSDAFLLPAVSEATGWDGSAGTTTMGVLERLTLGAAFKAKLLGLASEPPSGFALPQHDLVTKALQADMQARIGEAVSIGVLLRLGVHVPQYELATG